MASEWKDARGVIVTTTPSIEGSPIQEYCGIVVGEVIVGANIFRDLFANIRDIVGANFAKGARRSHRGIAGRSRLARGQCSGRDRSRLRSDRRHGIDADGLGQWDCC